MTNEEEVKALGQVFHHLEISKLTLQEAGSCYAAISSKINSIQILIQGICNVLENEKGR